MAGPLRVERPEPAIAVLTLDRPEKRNALSIELRDLLADTLDALAADEALEVVVLTGAGAVFCAGFDLREFDAALADPALAERLWASSDRYHRTVLSFPLPVVAALNGPAVAGGFDLAVLCDLRLATPEVRFSHPEIAFGDVVYAPLHDLVGGAVARELVLTGRTVEAEEALALRLVSRIVPPAELLDAALATARDIAVAPRETLLRTKAKILRRARIATDTGTLDL
ncbi:MAG: enoyl-CoA hydratase/isomerase family protein [Acidimicrobiales bacterium]|jgi:enoyl-CoA hydratase|nr:enoyl-CoA hydratase/isomerase family protein [Acidimicrobiales bacterium]